MKCILLSLALAGLAFAGLKTDIEFAKAGDLSLTLDANIPDGEGPFPTVIIVHGGGWRNGNKRTFVAPLFEPLTAAGFTWFSIDYRLAPSHHFPAPVTDVENAIRYVQSHAREYKVDLSRAVVPFYAPVDLEAMVVGQDKNDTALRAIQGLLDVTEPNDEAIRRLREASPIKYVKKGMPPIHGTADSLVAFRQSTIMCEKIKAAGSSCELFPVEGGAHGVNGWEKNPAFQKYKTKLVEWLKHTMQ